jgi:toxin ParE1/3/4
VRKLQLALRAQRDLQQILRDSEARFGTIVAGRYRRLIAAGLRDLREDPRRPGVQDRRDLPGEVRVYHLRHSRRHGPSTDRVARPRHFLIFRETADGLVVIRVLHDAMNLPSHLAET